MHEPQELRSLGLSPKQESSSPKQQSSASSFQCSKSNHYPKNRCWGDARLGAHAVNPKFSQVRSALKQEVGMPILETCLTKNIEGAGGGGGGGLGILDRRFGVEDSRDSGLGACMRL